MGKHILWGIKIVKGKLKKSILTFRTRERLTRREAVQYLYKTNHRSYARAARSAESKTTTEEGARSQVNGGQPSSEDTSSNETNLSERETSSSNTSKRKLSPSKEGKQGEKKEKLLHKTRRK